MTAGHAASRWVAVLVILAVVLACGAPATRASAEATITPGPSASGPPPDPAAPVAVGPANPGSRSIGAVDVALALAQAEVAARVARRADAEMTTLHGADAQVIAAALDAQTDTLLRELLAEAGVAVVPRPGLAGQLASISDGPPPIPVRTAVDLPSPGISLLGPWVTAVLMVDSAVEATAPYERSRNTTDEIAIGPSTGSVRTTSSVKVTPSGSKVVIEIDVKTSGEIIDANGVLLFKIEGVGQARIEAESCPDSAGLARASVAFSATETYFAGGGAGSVGQSWDSTTEADLRVYSNEAAEVDRTEVDARGEQASSGGTRTAGGQADTHGYGVGVAEAYTIAGTSGTLTSRGAQITDVDGATQANASDAFNLMFQLTGNAAVATATAVEAAWRSGKCVEVIVDPEGGDVEPSSVTAVTVKVKHKFEGTELDKPVEGTLSGDGELEPPSGAQPAPATVSYTAGPDEGDAGTIAFESISNRGIGKKSVTFTVASTAWTVGFEGTQRQSSNPQLGPGLVRLTARITDLRVTSSDGRLSGTGKLHLKGTITAGCFKGRLDQVVPIVLDGTRIGVGDEAVLRVSFSRPSASTGTVTLSCPAVASWDFPDAGYSEIFWYAVGTVDLPAGGGTVAIDHDDSFAPAGASPIAVTLQGTFTVTKVP